MASTCANAPVNASRSVSLFALMGSVTDILGYNRDGAYANELPVAVEDLDVGKLRSTAEEAEGRTRGHNFSSKAFWDSNPDWSCLRMPETLRWAVM